MGILIGRLIGLLIVVLAIIGLIVVVVQVISHFQMNQTYAVSQFASTQGRTATPTIANVITYESYLKTATTAALTATVTNTRVLPTNTAAPTATLAGTPAPLTVDQVYRWCYGWENCDMSRIVFNSTNIFIKPGPLMKFTFPANIIVHNYPCGGIQDTTTITTQETTLTMCSGDIRRIT